MRMPQYETAIYTPKKDLTKALADDTKIMAKVLLQKLSDAVVKAPKE